MTTRTLLLLPLLLLPSCLSFKMREITARNNGARFWMYTSNDNNNKWDFTGPVDKENRAHGLGSYVNRWAWNDHVHQSGNFNHGQPDGNHSFRGSMVEGVNRFTNGQYRGHAKTRNDMPMHLLNVATAGATAIGTSRSSSATGGANATAIGTSTTDITANYPGGYAYNVTTYGGQNATDSYDFITFYGITDQATAQQNLEAGRRVYGGNPNDPRFRIERVRVTKGSRIKTGIEAHQ
ncbi:MAG: hypothetical protein EOP87_00700 [Verrucomicrobiaceae bacterium]|nr:MAG: hypothetical protein EOP87_00700 [Verrucomicrobiaceae bacterium]